MIVYNSIIPIRGFIAINICGIIFVRKDLKSYFDESDLNHENIHTEQMKELGYIGFYVIYLLEYILWLAILWNFHYAYKSVSFEREAALYEKDLDYLSTRKHYTWLKLI